VKLLLGILVGSLLAIGAGIAAVWKALEFDWHG
jgi:hypothetical protein